MLSLLFANLFAGSHNKLAVGVRIIVRIIDILYRGTPNDARLERSYFVVAFVYHGRDFDTTEGTTIFFVNDHIMRHIHQTTSKVTGIGSLKSRIRKTLTSTVGRDKVLLYRKPFEEVRSNRVLNNSPTFATTLLRLSHKTTKPSQLTDLLLRTTGSGVEHHVNTIEAVVVFFEAPHHQIREEIGSFIPDSHDFVVARLIIDFPHTVLFDNTICLSRSLCDNSLLLGRDKHILEVKGKTTKERHTIAEVLYVVKELSCASNSADLEHIFNDPLERLLPEEFVDITNLIGDKVVEHKSPNRGLYNITLRLSIHNSCIGHHYLNGLMDIYTPIVVSDIGLLCTIENGGDTFLVNNLLLKLLLLRSQAAELRNVVKPEHHILRRHGNRLTTSRIEDIVRSQH